MLQHVHVPLYICYLCKCAFQSGTHLLVVNLISVFWYPSWLFCCSFSRLLNLICNPVGPSVLVGTGGEFGKMATCYPVYCNFLLLFVIVCCYTCTDILFVLDCAVLLVDCKLVYGVL